MATLEIIVETHAGDRPLRMNFDDAFPNEVLILRQIAQQGAYEIELASLFLRVLRDGDVVVDVGANVGYFSILAATCVGATGRVLAFEPDPANIARMEANIALNGFANVEVVGAPAFSRVEDVTFHFNASNNGGNALWDPAAYPGNEASRDAPRSLTIASTTLDIEAARRSLGPVKLIKVDTEGAEHAILEGARELIRETKVPFVVAELHDFGLKQMGSSQEAFRAYMEGLGYATFLLYNDDTLPRFVPPGTRILHQLIVNVLFATPATVAAHWGACYHDPRQGNAHPPAGFGRPAGA